MSREFYVPCTPYAYPIKAKLPNVGRHLKSLVQWRNSKKMMSEEATVFTVTDASSIIPNITDEILERVLPESSARVEKVDEIENENENENENELHSQTTDNLLTKSRSLGFRECPSVSSSLDVESTFPSTSSSNHPSNLRLATSEAIIRKIMSEVSAIHVSSSNPSASTDPSNVLMNGIPSVNLENIVNDPVNLLLAINSQIGSLAGRDPDNTQSAHASLFLTSGSQTDSYAGSSTSGNISNTTGSENSSMSEVLDSVDSQVSEYDPNREYYEIIRSIVRKQFDTLDDDPPIY